MDKVQKANSPVNLLLALKIYDHKKIVCDVKHKMPFIKFLQSYDIIICKICTLKCGKCVILCTIRAGESHFRNLFMV
jgi:hypothetical protein